MIKINKSLKSFTYAIRGIFKLFYYENNARVHLVASIIAILLSIVLHISKLEWLWILLSIALVWTTEAFNTAIEKIMDFISPEFNPRIADIKDLSAGAVLIAACFAFITGLIIFIPKFF